MLARHGIPVIADSLTFEHGLHVVKNTDSIAATADTRMPLEVVERNVMELSPSGERRLELSAGGRGGELSKLKTPDFVQCSQLVLSIPYEGVDWLESLLGVCFPFLRCLQLNCTGAPAA